MSAPVKGNLKIDTSAAVILDPNEWWYDICESESLGIMCAIEFGRQSGAATFRVSTSITGESWTGRPTGLLAPTDELKGICWSADLNLFVVVMNTNTVNAIITSPDGITWTLRAAPVIADWKSVVWSPQIGIFCAVADTTDGTVSAMMSSTDGITWTSVTMPTQFTFYSIAVSPVTGTLATTIKVNTAAPQNTLMGSKDGVDWYQFSPNEDEVIFKDCAFSSLDGSLVAVAELLVPETVAGRVPSQVYVFTETDVLTNVFSSGAKGALPHAAWRAITFSKGLGMFIAISSLPIKIDVYSQTITQAACSIDGITWRSIEHPGWDMNQYRSVLWSENNNKFIALATQSYAYRNVLIFNTYKVTITLTETILANDFEVVVFSVVGSHYILNHRSIRQAGTVDIPCLTNDAVMIAVYPRQGKSWEPVKDVVVGEFIVSTSTVLNPYYYRCTTAGKTYGLPPVFPTGPGSVTDGTAVWTYEGTLSKPSISGPHSPVLA